MSDFDQIPAVPANTPVVEENVIITEQAKDTTLTDQNVTQVQTLSTKDVVAAEVPVLKKKEVVIALDSFSWAEEPNYVKIYVDFEHANNLTDEQIHFVSITYDLSFPIYVFANIMYKMLYRATRSTRWN